VESSIIILFHSNILSFDIPYGGFGTVINKAALAQLSVPIYCHGSVSNDKVCELIKESSFGEASIFEDGMSIFQLFYLYSSVNNFCFHSDWLLGYVLTKYVQNDNHQHSQTTITAVEAYPSCGNFTETTGATRLCTKESTTCHNLDPTDMEFLALNSFVKSPDQYDVKPMRSTTDLLTAYSIIKLSQEEQNQKRQPKKYAYATVLGVNPDNEQNQIYLHAVQILLTSLKSSPIADFVVLMTYHDQKVEHLLQREGAIIKHIQPIEYAVPAPQFESWFVDIALSKIRAFELTQYLRVQVIDADSYVQDANEMDKLFTAYPETNLVAEGLGGDSPLRAGWILIKPSQHDFREMEDIFKRGNFDSKYGWDGMELKAEYPGWDAKKDDADEWDFYGSQLEQGKIIRIGRKPLP
jgi:hypothetical protein